MVPRLFRLISWRWYVSPSVVAGRSAIGWWCHCQTMLGDGTAWWHELLLKGISPQKNWVRHLCLIIPSRKSLQHVITMGVGTCLLHMGMFDHWSRSCYHRGLSWYSSSFCLERSTKSYSIIYVYMDRLVFSPQDLKKRLAMFTRRFCGPHGGVNHTLSWKRARSGPP